MTSAQVSIFDTAAGKVGSRYKAGDYVKLQKKPAIACGIKRGEVFQINAVHPTDGSMRFWNPHINQWNFLYPEEVKLIKAPVESVVGEPMAASSTVESVVGEPMAASSTVESVVGEAKNYYNSNTGYSRNGWLETHYKIRRDGKQHSINCPEIGCTGPYYSYRWMEGKRQRAKYCPRNKYTKVQRAIRKGKAIGDIIKIISE